MYFMKSISDDVRLSHSAFRQHTKVQRLIFGAFLACIAAILQGAGGFLPGVGYLISPFATTPILIGAMFSFQLGMMSYLLTILLLLVLVPSELFIFPFTTGLLGIGIGIAFFFFKKRVTIVLNGAIFLTFGILSLLYLFRFPILGPVVGHSFSFLIAGTIFFFSFLYSWFWVEFALFFFKKIRRSLT